MKNLLLAATLAFAFSAAPALVSSAHAGPHAVTKKKKEDKSRAGQTGIEWKVLPGTVEIHIDGKLIGIAKDLDWTKTTPGRHTVRLVNGEDETEMDIGVKKGQTLKFVFEFDNS